MAVPVRARDLRANISEWGFEKGVVITLEHLLDEYTETRQHLRGVVELLDKCIDEITKFNAIAGGMKTTIEQMRRDRNNEEPGEPV